MKFLFAGFLPLIFGLLLAAFGVALAVGAFPPQFVRSTAKWTLVGTATMGVLVVTTYIGTTGMAATEFHPGPIFSNFLIGGAIAGTLVGVYAGQNILQRETLKQQANRLATLNRILRDQVLNAVTIIQGNVDLLSGRNDGNPKSSIDTISTQSDIIEESVAQVGRLAGSTEEGSRQRINVSSVIGSAKADVESTFPEATISTDVPESLSVLANQDLERVFYHLLDNAIRYAGTDDPTVKIEGESRGRTAIIRVSDSGPGLPPEEQATLESGTITEFDDPRSGFGLNIIRFLVDSYGGEIWVEHSDEGTTIVIELMQDDTGLPMLQTGFDPVRASGVTPKHLAWGIGAALVAGLIMGVIMQGMAGLVPVIGALYGVQDPLVGWITHEFHSIVFGMIYVSLVRAFVPEKSDLAGRLGVALVFAMFLWLVAAGIIMPFWLSLLGLPASLPNLTSAALIGHLAWGITLGGGYHIIACRDSKTS